jgi:hypothetical protein
VLIVQDPPIIGEATQRPNTALNQMEHFDGIKSVLANLSNWLSIALPKARIPRFFTIVFNIGNSNPWLRVVLTSGNRIPRTFHTT